MPELPPAPGTGASGGPFLERVSSTAAAAASGLAGPTRPIALRRSSSFGARPGSGAGSFNGRSLGRSISRASLLGGPGSRNSSYQDLSNRGVREALLPSEE